MEHFIFALNATMPIFLLILLGWFLQRIKLTNDIFNKTADTFVFKCALPFSLFVSISKMDFYSDFDLKFCLFCFLCTTVMFFGTWWISALVLKDKTAIGAFAQASVRSSSAILGVTLAISIYGETGMVPMMILSAVPFFNIYSVLILNFSPQMDENGNLLPGSKGNGAVKKALRNIVTNPMVIGILSGVPFSIFKIHLPSILLDGMTMIGDTASPLALLAVGGSFSAAEALKRWKLAAVASFVKLMALPAVLLALAAALGFRNSEMVAILIMAGSPTTVACYVMARNMHADTVLTSNTIVLSTLFSSVTITFWLFILRTFGLL